MAERPRLLTRDAGHQPQGPQHAERPERLHVESSPLPSQGVGPIGFGGLL